MMDSNKAFREILSDKGHDDETITFLLKHHPKIIARKDSVSKLTGRDIRKRLLDQEQRMPLPFKCRHKITSADDGDEYFFGMKYFEYGNGEVWCHVELIVDISDSYSSERINPSFTMFPEDATLDNETEYNQDTVMTDASSLHHSASKTRKSSKVNLRDVLYDDGTASKSIKTPSKSTRSSRKSSTTGSKSNRLPTEVDLSYVSSVNGAESSFLTPINNSNMDSFSLDDSTIKTLDPYNYSNRGGHTSTALTVASSKKSKSSKAKLVTPRKGQVRSSSRNKKSVELNSDDEKSRSGRSSSSKSSNTSDTPSRNNLTSLKINPHLKNLIAPTKSNTHSMILPMEDLKNTKVPKNILSNHDHHSSRLTRQGLKRLKNDERSHSSDESHQRQSKKKERK